MARDVMRAIDPVRLMQDTGIAQPDQWQIDTLREVASGAASRVLLNCARQVGKTECAINLVEWFSLYRPGSLSLIVSPSQRQSGEVFRRLMLLHSSLKDVPELTAESALRAVYANQSRVLALPGSEKTTRGYAAADLIICDEAAGIDDSLIASIRPMLALREGTLIMMSTPRGERGEFHRAWTEGGDGWRRVKVDANMCPRLSEDYLRDERAQMGELLFRQEFMCEFIADGELLFAVDLFKSCFNHLEVEVFF